MANKKIYDTICCKEPSIVYGEYNFSNAVNDMEGVEGFPIQNGFFADSDITVTKYVKKNIKTNDYDTGWLIKKSDPADDKKINFYLNKHPDYYIEKIPYFQLKSMWVRVKPFGDDKNIFFNLYTEVGDGDSGWYHSKVNFVLSTATQNKIKTGDEYVLYIGEKPPHKHLKHLTFYKLDFSGTGSSDSSLAALVKKGLTPLNYSHISIQSNSRGAPNWVFFESGYNVFNTEYVMKYR